MKDKRQKIFFCIAAILLILSETSNVIVHLIQTILLRNSPGTFLYVVRRIGRTDPRALITIFLSEGLFWIFAIAIAALIVFLFMQKEKLCGIVLLTTVCINILSEIQLYLQASLNISILPQSLVFIISHALIFMLALLMLGVFKGKAVRVMGIVIAALFIIPYMLNIVTVGQNISVLISMSELYRQEYMRNYLITQILGIVNPAVYLAYVPDALMSLGTAFKKREKAAVTQEEQAHIS